MSLRLHCPACEKETLVEGFAIEAAAVLVSCGNCGVSVRVAADPAEAVALTGVVATETSEDHEMICPKCETGQPQAEACRSCGLLAERMVDFESESDGDLVLQELWAEVECHFDDDQVHEKFLAQAVELGVFSTAARRYRSRARTGDARAQAYLERVSRMAQAMLTTRPDDPSPQETTEPFRGVALMLIVLLLVGAVVGVYAVVKGQGQAPIRRPSSTGSSR